ncbi:hypothetical protein E2C01_031742 [Portunus trituberculatus]|uniref:Uncharacterized protein n=1 Tax=Portunus trituberculatus TaxID=210409 RepID=A0A5B7EYM6_PORTR|nr:hypothetical protein [Portunus trituberculatus]
MIHSRGSPQTQTVNTEDEHNPGPPVDLLDPVPSISSCQVDSTQELDQEVKEVIRLGRFSEGGKRPMKVSMRLQVAVEEIMTRKGKLADDT